MIPLNCYLSIRADINLNYNVNYAHLKNKMSTRKKNCFFVKFTVTKLNKMFLLLFFSRAPALNFLE